MSTILLDIFSGALLDWDRSTFHLINDVWSHSFLDSILPLWRNKYTWIPFYLVIVIISLLKFKKKAIPFLLFAIISVSLADIISSHFFKPYFDRIRPCGQEALDVILRYQHCPGNGSFTSSHAATHFALAFFLIVTLRRWLGNWVWILLLWAAIISYAQVYIGIHFPLDVIGGGLLGSIIGISMGLINRRIWYKKWQ